MALACDPASTNAVARRSLSPAERAATVHKWMAREVAPLPTNPVRFEGLATSEIESKTPPHLECKKEDDGEPICTVAADLGKDDDGTDLGISCTIRESMAPFGVVTKELLGTLAPKATLTETPVVDVRRLGGGLYVSFTANTERDDETTTSFGTAKVASFYAPGAAATCVDMMPGGRATFARITRHFFESLQIKPTSGALAPMTFAMAYRSHEGDRTSGFRFQFIRQRTDSGFEEGWVSTTLDTDGRTWSFKDDAAVVERDGKGTIEKQTYLFWPDGQGPLALTAKPTEEKRFRLKLDVGAKTNALEATPKATLGTDLWAAPELLRVSNGSARTYRYAILDVSNDGDPAFGYLSFTRARQGVVLQEQESPARIGAAKEAKPATKDELYVNESGLVTKQVSSESVTELLGTWGELPRLLRGMKR